MTSQKPLNCLVNPNHPVLRDGDRNKTSEPTSANPAPNNSIHGQRTQNTFQATVPVYLEDASSSRSDRNSSPFPPIAELKPQTRITETNLTQFETAGDLMIGDNCGKSKTIVDANENASQAISLRRTRTHSVGFSKADRSDSLTAMRTKHMKFLRTKEDSSCVATESGIQEILTTVQNRGNQLGEHENLHSHGFDYNNECEELGILEPLNRNSAVTEQSIDNSTSISLPDTNTNAQPFDNTNTLSITVRNSNTQFRHEVSQHPIVMSTNATSILFSKTAISSQSKVLCDDNKIENTKSFQNFNSSQTAPAVHLTENEFCNSSTESCTNYNTDCILNTNVGNTLSQSAESSSTKEFYHPLLEALTNYGKDILDASATRNSSQEVDNITETSLSVYNPPRDHTNFFRQDYISNTSVNDAWFRLIANYIADGLDQYLSKTRTENTNAASTWSRRIADFLADAFDYHDPPEALSKGIENYIIKVYSINIMIQAKMGYIPHLSQPDFLESSVYNRIYYNLNPNAVSTFTQSTANSTADGSFLYNTPESLIYNGEDYILNNAANILTQTTMNSTRDMFDRLNPSRVLADNRNNYCPNTLSELNFNSYANALGFYGSSQGRNYDNQHYIRNSNAASTSRQLTLNSIIEASGLYNNALSARTDNIQEFRGSLPQWSLSEVSGFSENTLGGRLGYPNTIHDYWNLRNRNAACKSSLSTVNYFTNESCYPPLGTLIDSSEDYALKENVISILRQPSVKYSNPQLSTQSDYSEVGISCTNAAGTSGQKNGSSCSNGSYNPMSEVHTNYVPNYDVASSSSQLVSRVFTKQTYTECRSQGHQHQVDYYCIPSNTPKPKSSGFVTGQFRPSRSNKKSPIRHKRLSNQLNELSNSPLQDSSSIRCDGSSSTLERPSVLSADRISEPSTNSKFQKQLSLGQLNNSSASVVSEQSANNSNTQSFSVIDRRSQSSVCTSSGFSQTKEVSRITHEIHNSLFDVMGNLQILTLSEAHHSLIHDGMQSEPSFAVDVDGQVAIMLHEHINEECISQSMPFYKPSHTDRAKQRQLEREDTVRRVLSVIHSRTSDREVLKRMVAGTLFNNIRCASVQELKGCYLSSNSSGNKYPSVDLVLQTKLSPPIYSSDTEEVCAICWADYSEEDLKKSNLCRHMFHLKCINRWLKDSKTCPICRQPWG